MTTHGVIDPLTGVFHGARAGDIASAAATAQGNANLHQKPVERASFDEATGKITRHEAVLPNVNGGANTISSIVSGGGSPPPGVRTRIQARTPFTRGRK
jgi:hypothetical protein